MWINRRKIDLGSQSSLGIYSSHNHIVLFNRKPPRLLAFLFIIQVGVHPLLLGYCRIAFHRQLTPANVPSNARASLPGSDSIPFVKPALFTAGNALAGGVCGATPATRSSSLTCLGRIASVSSAFSNSAAFGNRWAGFFASARSTRSCKT